MTNKIQCEIKYNKAAEFISSIMKYIGNQTRQVYLNNPEVEKDIAKDIVDFSPSSKVKDWLKYIDDNISPFFRNDLIFVTDPIYKLLDVCFHLILLEDIQDPLELIESLKLLDTNTMIQITYKFYELEASLDDEEKLKSDLIENFSEEIATSFLHFNNHPDLYKESLIKVLINFYKQFYEPYEEAVYTYMEKRIVIHHELFEKDPISFINTIGIGDYTEAINMHTNLVVYMSFFMDVGIIYFTVEETLVLYCGQMIEHRFEKRKEIDTYKALFKALSDNKRIEILKMASKRPWYNKELADYFNLTPATLSYHLNLLLDLEILNFEPSIINNRYYYTTNKKKLSDLFDIALEDLLN